LSLFLALNIILNSVVEITYETNQTQTNEFLKDCHTSIITVVIAENKLKERGMGSVWEAEGGKNLIVSVFIRIRC
jgi:hypothetical protein